MALALSLCATVASAQAPTTLATDAQLLKDPGGTVVATLPKGGAFGAGAPRNGWREVTLEGWVYTSSLGADARDGFDVGVTAGAGENLRAEPNGRRLARLRTGALFKKVETRAGWTHVKRSGWVAASAFVTAPAPATATAAPRPDSATAAPDASAPADGRGEIGRAAALRLTPDGGELGKLVPGAAVRTTGRSGEWVRVQVDGWVRESELKAPATGIESGVTAAALRANPSKYEGTTVEWRVQFIALRTADELRPELTPGQPYLLVRGPLPEPGFVYVTVSEAQAQEFRRTPPLDELTVRATIRTARSRYIGTPIVQLVSVVGAS